MARHRPREPDLFYAICRSRMRRSCRFSTTSTRATRSSATTAPRFFFLTDQRRRAAAWSRSIVARRSRERWNDDHPRGRGTRCAGRCALVGERFIVQLPEGRPRALVAFFALDGTFEREIALPALGTVGGLRRARADTETFYAFTSFHVSDDDLPLRRDAGRARVFRQPKVDFDPADVRDEAGLLPDARTARRSRCSSSHKKGLTLDGTQPDAALRLRRLQHLADARASRSAILGVDGDGRRLRAAEPARRRRIRRGVARGRACSATSRTSSTTSSPPPNG